MSSVTLKKYIEVFDTVDIVKGSPSSPKLMIFLKFFEGGGGLFLI